MAFIAYVDRSRVDSLLAGAKRAIAESKHLRQRATTALDQSMRLVRDHEAGRRDDGESPSVHPVDALFLCGRVRTRVT